MSSAAKIVERIQIKIVALDEQLDAIESDIATLKQKHEHLTQARNVLSDLLDGDEKVEVKPEKSGRAKRVCWICGLAPTPDNPLKKIDGHLIHVGHDSVPDGTIVSMHCDNCGKTVDAKYVGGSPYCPKCESKIRTK